MPLNRINPSAPLTRQLVDAGVFAPAPFCLIDVGCSGGIESQWRVFDNQLGAYGLDALANECERLNREELNPGVHYFARWVRWPEYARHYKVEKEFTPKTSWPFARASFWRAMQLTNYDTNRLFSANKSEAVMATEETSVDRFVFDQRLSSVDYIKIDTDGADLEALLSGQRTLVEKGVLAVKIESLLHGPDHPYANTWPNIDRVLRKAGFSLFDFDRFRVSRAALPDAFMFEAPSATWRGQVAWCDALYVRDVAHPGYLAQWVDLAPIKLLKAACIFEICGLPDCAAEILLVHRARLSALLDVDAALDTLAGEWWPGREYRSVVGRFEESPSAFYPSGDHGHPPETRAYEA